MAFGALYFTLECPSDFTNLQDALLGLTASVTLIIHQKLSGRTRVLWEAMSEVGGVLAVRFWVRWTGLCSGWLAAAIPLNLRAHSFLFYRPKIS